MKSYGTIKLDKSGTSWQIECQPHVAIRLKRMFGKVDKAQHGKITLKCSPETTRDLEWFLVRYPMEVKNRDQFAKLSQAHKDRLALIDELLEKRGGPGHRFDLAVPLREYQKTAAELGLATRGLLIADDVGLEKPLTSSPWLQKTPVCGRPWWSP